MTIWIITLVAFGIPALIGLFAGAIQAGFVFLGSVLGLFLAIPLGGVIKPVFTVCGMTNPFWLMIWPPIAVFLLLQVIAWIIGFLTHRKILLHHRHVSDEYHLHRWERMNGRLGGCVGVLVGFIYLLGAATGLYGIGYLTTQLASPEKDPVWLGWINDFRAQMRSTGLDRLVSGLDPMPKAFYQVADLLGLVYQNNPAINKHVYEYPPFFTLADRSDVKEIIEDKDFMEGLKQKMSVAELMRHPRVLAVMGNADLGQQFLQLDLKDVREYLEKGKSLKFDSLAIVGFWDLDVAQSVNNIKRTTPDITAKQLLELRRTLVSMSAGSFLKANVDSRLALTLKGEVMDFSSMNFVRVPAASPTGAAVAPRRPNTRGLGVAPTALAPAVRQRFATAPSSMSPEMVARYGPPRAPMPPPQMPPPDGGGGGGGGGGDGTTNATVKIDTKTYEGSWEGDGDTYTIKIKGERDKEYVSDILIEADQMTLVFADKPLIFVKRIL